MTIAKNGVFIDTKTSTVVDSQPEEGVQLVAPGSEVTPALQEKIDAAKAALEVATEDDDVETATENKTVTTKSAARKG